MMSRLPLPGRRLAAAGMISLVGLFAGCGGGGSVDVVVAVPTPPPIISLGISLSRVGPQTVEVDWSDDPYVARFTVSRDGSALASVASTALIDDSVVLNQSYCYLVTGYDGAGNLIAESDIACITIVP